MLEVRRWDWLAVQFGDSLEVDQPLWGNKDKVVFMIVWSSILAKVSVQNESQAGSGQSSDAASVLAKRTK